MHSNSLKNLKPAEKGKALNPGGKPKGTYSTKALLRKYLSVVHKVSKNPMTGKLEPITVAETMTFAIIEKAMKGDLHAYREILDRLEGKPQQKVEQTTNGTLEVTQVIRTPEKKPLNKPE